MNTYYDGIKANIHLKTFILLFPNQIICAFITFPDVFHVANFQNFIYCIFEWNHQIVSGLSEYLEWIFTVCEIDYPTENTFFHLNQLSTEKGTKEKMNLFHMTMKKKLFSSKKLRPLFLKHHINSKNEAQEGGLAIHDHT